MGYFSIERISNFEEFTQSSQRVRDLKQWSHGVVAQSSEKIFGRRSEIHNVTTFMQQSAIVDAQHSATASS